MRKFKNSGSAPTYLTHTFAVYGTLANKSNVSITFEEGDIITDDLVIEETDDKVYTDFGSLIAEFNKSDLSKF